ncbi:MAG: hypothetical protein KDD70_16245 [Bdellovibrionales bacterium]|nr:hypothetical protein [Bdellovibrionales bacterium]
MSSISAMMGKSTTTAVPKKQRSGLVGGVPLVQFATQVKQVGSDVRLFSEVFFLRVTCDAY